MKIKLSKSQWEEAGKKAGWMKTACSTCPTHNKTDSGKKDEGKKGKAVNPWAVCNSTSPKKENPEKFERCVQDVKKEHPIKKD